MAAYLRTVRSISRTEYRVFVPTNATELDKAITAAIHERASVLPAETITDDMLQVRVEDDAIVIWWETEK